MGQKNFEKCQPLWRADKGSSKKYTKNDSIELRKQNKKQKTKKEQTNKETNKQTKDKMKIKF